MSHCTRITTAAVAALLVAGAAAQPGGRPIHTWAVSVSAARIDGAVDVLVSQLSDDTIRELYAGTSRPRLTVHCASGDLRVYVDLGTQLQPNFPYGPRIRLRVDQRPIISVIGTESTDGRAAFLPTPRRMLNELLRGKVLVVEATPFQRSTAEFSFDLTGLEAALAPARKHCRW